MKKLFSVAIAAILLLSLLGCSLNYVWVDKAIDSYSLGYSEKYRKAFLSTYYWDGSEEGTSLALPEAYNDAVIFGLGGYTGRGYPCPFSVELDDSAKKLLCSDATEWYYSHKDDLENHSVEYLNFNIHVGENIREAENLNLDLVYIAEYYENGEKRSSAYVPIFSFTCEENNKSFYAKNGKLYYKANDTLVEGINYVD
jgi:hypothetical protein